MIENYLLQLTEELQLPKVGSPDKEGFFRFVVHPELTIRTKSLKSGYYFHSLIGPLPEERKEEFVLYAMKANYLGQGTGGAALGLNNDGKILALSLPLPYEMNYISFREAIEDFANFADYWKEELKRHNQLDK